MVSFREILRGTLTRFVPAAIVGQAVIIILLLAGEPYGLVWGDTTILAGFTLALAAGHLGALSAVRRFLRSDADVAGRRALISGLAAGAVHFGTAAALQDLTVTDGFPLGLESGAVAALLMFFPWIGRQQAAPVDVEIPREILDELALTESPDLDWPPVTQSAERERVRRDPES